MSASLSAAMALGGGVHAEPLRRWQSLQDDQRRLQGWQAQQVDAEVRFDRGRGEQTVRVVDALLPGTSEWRTVSCSEPALRAALRIPLPLPLDPAGAPERLLLTAETAGFANGAGDRLWVDGSLGRGKTVQFHAEAQLDASGDRLSALRYVFVGLPMVSDCEIELRWAHDATSGHWLPATMRCRLSVDLLLSRMRLDRSSHFTAWRQDAARTIADVRKLA